MTLPALPPLPPGYARTPYLVPPLVLDEPEPDPVPTPAPVPPVSAVLTDVMSRGGALVTLHRQDYRAAVANGREWLVDGYAWRCPRCPRLVGGYATYVRALDAAADHDCRREVTRDR